MIYHFNKLFSDNIKPTVYNMTPDSTSNLIRLLDSMNKEYEKKKKRSKEHRISRFYRERIREMARPLSIKDSYTTTYEQPGEYTVAIGNMFQTTMYVLFKHYGPKFYLLGVQAVDITESNDIIKVYMRLLRPGYLIGKGGADLTMVEQKLSRLFCKDTVIDITEAQGNYPRLRCRENY